MTVEYVVLLWVEFWAAECLASFIVEMSFDSGEVDAVHIHPFLISNS